MGARAGSSMPEDLRLVAVARLFLRPWIKNIQVSWVKMGPKLAQLGLMSGANDFGGTLMEESITRESGSQFGENLPAEEMRRLIREIGRTPVERSTTYGRCGASTIRRSTRRRSSPKRERELSGPERWRLAQEQAAPRAAAAAARSTADRAAVRSQSDRAAPRAPRPGSAAARARGCGAPPRAIALLTAG